MTLQYKLKKLMLTEVVKYAVSDAKTTQKRSSKVRTSNYIPFLHT
jgi:hypothetical protein